MNKPLMCISCGHTGKDVCNCIVRKQPYQLGTRMALCEHCVMMARDMRMMVTVEDDQPYE